MNLFATVKGERYLNGRKVVVSKEQGSNTGIQAVFTAERQNILGVNIMYQNGGVMVEIYGRNGKEILRECYSVGYLQKGEKQEDVKCYRLGCTKYGTHKIADMKSLVYGEYACEEHKK